MASLGPRVALKNGNASSPQKKRKTVTFAEPRVPLPNTTPSRNNGIASSFANGSASDNDRFLTNNTSFAVRPLDAVRAGPAPNPDTVMNNGLPPVSPQETHRNRRRPPNNYPVQPIPRSSGGKQRFGHPFRRTCNGADNGGYFGRPTPPPEPESEPSEAGLPDPELSHKDIEPRYAGFAELYEPGSAVRRLFEPHLLDHDGESGEPLARHARVGEPSEEYVLYYSSSSEDDDVELPLYVRQFQDADDLSDTETPEPEFVCCNFPLYCARHQWVAEDPSSSSLAPKPVQIKYRRQRQLDLGIIPKPDVFWKGYAKYTSSGHYAMPRQYSAQAKDIPHRRWLPVPQSEALKEPELSVELNNVAMLNNRDNPQNRLRMQATNNWTLSFRSERGGTPPLASEPMPTLRYDFMKEDMVVGAGSVAIRGQGQMGQGMQPGWGWGAAGGAGGSIIPGGVVLSVEEHIPLPRGAPVTGWASFIENRGPTMQRIDEELNREDVEMRRGRIEEEFDAVFAGALAGVMNKKKKTPDREGGEVGEVGEGDEGGESGEDGEDAEDDEDGEGDPE